MPNNIDVYNIFLVFSYYHYSENGMEIETKLTSRLVSGGRKANALVLNVHGHERQSPGWPDIFVAHTYWSGWIEFKGPETEIRGHQKRIIKELLERGVRVRTVRFLEQELNYWKFRIEHWENKLTLKIFDVDDTDPKVFVTLMKELTLL